MLKSLFNKLKYFVRQFYSSCGKSIFLLHQNNWLSVEPTLNVNRTWSVHLFRMITYPFSSYGNFFLMSGLKLIINPSSVYVKPFNNFHKPFSCLGNLFDNFHMPFSRLHDPFENFDKLFSRLGNSLKNLHKPFRILDSLFSCSIAFVWMAKLPVCYPFCSCAFHPLNGKPFVYIFPWKITN